MDEQPSALYQDRHGLSIALDNCPRGQFESSWCSVPDIPSRAPAFVRAFEESLARGPDRAEFRVLRYALLPDQAHFIVKARDRHALGRGMKSLTKRMVWAMRSAFGWRGRLLADRYRLQILKTPREVRTANRDVHAMSRRSAANRSGRSLTRSGD